MANRDTVEAHVTPGLHQVEQGPLAGNLSVSLGGLPVLASTRARLSPGQFWSLLALRSPVVP